MTDLVLEHVSHSFADGVAVVDDLSLEVPSGHIVCLLGPSGCGKTTTLRLAAGLERLQAGRIRIGDQIVAEPGFSAPPERRGVGLVFQDYALFPHLTAAQNVAFGLQGNAAERRRIALDYLKPVGLTRLADAYPHTLSGGEQQRVALARALAPRPAAMLLDEPFSGLDTRLRDAIRQDTLRLLHDDGAATLMVTHDPEEAMFMADAIAVMRAGRIVQVGTPLEVYHRPVDRFVAEFFSETNAIAGTVGEDRCVATAYGTIGPVELAPGTDVDVLLRPEALEINGVENGATADVLTVRALGATALIDLRGPDSDQHLRARLPADRLPRPGERVGVAMKTGQALVFPRQDNT
ncbi:MAG: ABC transporter ATP-binding protein [Alphaproteobacteria bacterium]